jgi:hypothetical protein
VLHPEAEYKFALTPLFFDQKNVALNAYFPITFILNFPRTTVVSIFNISEILQIILVFQFVRDAGQDGNAKIPIAAGYSMGPKLDEGE